MTVLSSHRVRSLKSGGYIGQFACLLLSVVATANACSDGGADGAYGATPAPPPSVIGNVDKPSNATVRVDENELSAVATASTVTFDVPVSALGRAAKGELNLTLISVDGSKNLETSKLPYDLPDSGSDVLHATVSTPSDVQVQADWVRYSVRIDDGSVGGLLVTSSLLRVVKPYEVRLEGPENVSKDKEVSYRVRAQHPVTKEPLPNADVALEVDEGSGVIQTLTGTTDSTGDAVFQVTLNDTGTFDVQAKTTKDATTARVEHQITVAERGKKVLLTTDKPLYQPGQTVHLRALALTPPSNAPLASATTVFEVQDGKGNKVFHKELTTDQYGVASTDFVIGPIVNEGTFKTQVTVGTVETEKTVEVSHYALPKFGLDVSVDRPWYSAGEAVTGTVDARYFFGKAVANSDVTIEAYTLDVGETVFQKIVGKTDANGKMSFTVTLPQSLVGLPLEQGNALANLRVTVNDSAGQSVTKETPVTVAQDAVRLTVVPESTTIVPGLANFLEVFATDPVGAPVPNAPVTLDVGGSQLSGSTDAFGHLELSWTPSAGVTQANLTATVTPSSGSAVTKTFSFGGQSGAEHILVRTDKSVYDIGETVNIEVVASGSEAHAYVDWLNEAQAVDMRTVDLSAGSAKFSMTLDSSLLGSNRVEAYIVDDGGNVVRAGRTVFVRGAANLDVSVSTDKTSYTPGEPATLTFSVKDEQGKPSVAALGVQVVDEAVFSLVDARPGLLQTYFEIEDSYSTPHYEIDAPPVSMMDLLFQKTRSKDANENQAAQAEAAATFAAMGGSSITGIQEGSWTHVIADAKANLVPFYVALKPAVVKALHAVASDQILALSLEKCTPGTYCQTLQMDFMSALAVRVKGAFSATDFWGNPFAANVAPYGSITLTTNGPDEKSSTPDDDTISVEWTELSLDDALNKSAHSAGDAGVAFPGQTPGGDIFGVGSGGFTGAGGASAAAGTGPVSTPPPNAGGDAAAPRVRKNFPETLYVNPEVITGADGTAKVTVNLADSITSWRVSTLANSASGKLGGGLGGVTVFQDFFVDVDFPASLTRGDEVEFPVAVYNYLTAPQTVHLTLDPGTWYTALGPTTLDVVLQPGEVTGVRFPVRVEQVGHQALTVRATGTAASDAVQRSVNVLPDGKAFPDSHSGSFGAGTVTQTVTFPAGTITGSEKLYIDVYPGYLSQVVQGMDSLLQVPSGCFEQTTSTTWPNVLALDYMQKTKQITTDVQLKADSYINAGYQRLLTFEHPGGGYSWFGTQDPAPYLSVTALGVMEFSDMAKVHTVDQAMIDRTVNWLVAQQKPDGSWPGDQSEFFDIETSAVRNTAFTVWALASAGHTGADLDRGVSYIKGQLGSSSQDGYSLALAANALVLAAPSDPKTAEVLANLDSEKQTNGTKVFWDSGASQTNFYASGDDAAVTATGMVAHAMMSAGAYAADVKGALEYLAAAKDANGNFGSTQATVWALRALVLAASRGTDTAVGSLDVSVDGAPFRTLALTQSQGDVLTTVDLSTLAAGGSHDVTLSFAGTGQVSYNLVSSYNLPWANVQPDTGPLAVNVAYDKTDLRLNDTVQATVTVSNTTASMENMILVTVGIPPGFAVKTEDLDAYKTTRTLSRYDLTEKQLTLYLSALSPNASQAFSYHLVATMPITAVDGGAQAYLYYQPKQKVTSQSQQLKVSAI